MPNQPEDIFGSVDEAASPTLPRRGLGGIPGGGRGVPPVNLPGADTMLPKSGQSPLLSAAPRAAAPPPPPPIAPPRTLASLPTPGAIPPGRPAAVPPQPFPTDADRPNISKQSPVFGRKSVMLTVGGLIAVAVVGVGGWWAFATFVNPSRPSGASVTPPATNPTPPPGPAATPAPEPAGVLPPPQPSPAVVEPGPAGAELDSDFDGVSDREEKLYGTDPFATDTDADGLTDRDEVMVFGTDPTKADTDGDTFPDGQEVTNGFDPKGPGRIKTAPAQ